MTGTLATMKRDKDGILILPSGASSKGWHEISPLIMCPKEYQYARVRQVQIRSPFLSEALSIGLLLHAARAQWLADGYKGDLWRKAIVVHAKQPEGSKPLHPVAIGAATSYFKGYVDYWMVRPRSEVLAVEYELQPRGWENAPEWLKRTARLDSIERWRGKTYIGECKSSSSSASRVAETYSLHGQTQLQVALYGPDEVRKFGPLEGVLLDVIIKKKGEGSGAERIPLPLSGMKHATQWFKKDFERWAMQAATIKWNDDVEHRPTCQRSYGPCDFRELCLRGKDGCLGFETADRVPLSKWEPSPGKTTPPWE